MSEPPVVEIVFHNVLVKSWVPLWADQCIVEETTCSLKLVQNEEGIRSTRIKVSHNKKPGEELTEHVYDMSTLLENTVVRLAYPDDAVFRITIYLQGAPRGTPAERTQLTMAKATDADEFDATLDFFIRLGAMRIRSKMNAQEPRNSGKF